MAQDKRLTDQLPTEQLTTELQALLRAVGQRALRKATGSLGGVAERIAGTAAETGKEVVGGVVEKAGGKGGLVKKLAGGAVGKVAEAGKAAPEKLKEAVTGGGGGKGAGKITNIVESIDVGVPVWVAYDQWTRFTDFPDFLKKVEKVEQESDTELSWRAQILWSHRDWKSTIMDQVPDERIVWKSEGAKGYVDGAVTFHELAPNLTRILVVLEYYPQGLFEKTGNLWRAQGRRVRLELKHFRRHVMTENLLHPEEVEGWRGEIHDGEVSQEPQGRDEGGAGERQEQGQERDDDNDRQDQ